MLGGIPSMGIAETHPAKTVKEILEQNLKDEKEAVDFYRKIHEAVVKERGKGYYDFLLEHGVGHVIMDEQEHITELELLLGKSGSSY